MTVTRGRPRRKSSAKSYVEDIVDEDDIEAPEDMDVDAEIPEEEEEASEGQNSASDETESEGKGDTHIGTFLKGPWNRTACVQSILNQQKTEKKHGDQYDSFEWLIINESFEWVIKIINYLTWLINYDSYWMRHAVWLMLEVFIEEK